MLRLPPPKNASSDQKVEPSIPPPLATTATALVLSTDVVSRGRTNVKASLTDLVPAGPQATVDRLSISKEEEHATASKTALALSKIVGIKVAATNQLKTSLDAAQNQNKTSTFIKVNGSTDSLTGKISQDRVFRMVEKAADPLEPPKFKYRAAPQAPGSPPVPVLHSPSRKATAEEKAAWDVPVNVSNWNNPNGHVISLDNRLSQNMKMEGPILNDRFAKFSEALLSAEDAKRIEVSERAKLKHVNEEKRRETENESLRIAAAQARAARAQAALTLSAGGYAPTTGANSIAVSQSSRGQDTPPSRRRSQSTSSESEGKSGDEEDRKARRERDRLRLERKRELEREMKLEAAGKRTKAMREEERDVSERVALGMPVPKGSTGFETEFDHRLFNRGAAGLASGHGAEDEDSNYTTSLFRDPSQTVYRPSTEVRSSKTSQDLQTKLDEIKSSGDKFVHRGFKGSESGGAQAPREGPVQFERSAATSALPVDDPLHGIALSAAQRRTADVFDNMATRKATSMSMGRFAGSLGSSTQSRPHTLDEPDEREEQEERMIRKLKEKESRGKQISFVKGSE